MVTSQLEIERSQRHLGDRAELQYERWVHWPVNWSAIWVGGLAAICALVIFGLIGIAIGAYALGPEHRVVSWSKFSIAALIVSVLGSFLAFVIGGWVAGKIAGILRSVPGMLHGAIVWLVAIPILVALAALGAGNALGAWYGGLTGKPSWATSSSAPFDPPEPMPVNATPGERVQFQQDVAAYRQKVHQWKDETPRALRNSALGAVTALLLGLMGSVLGGWMASGEKMSFRYQPRGDGRPVPEASAIP